MSTHPTQSTHSVVSTGATVLLASYTPGQIAFITFIKSVRDTLNVYDECTLTRVELVEAIKGSAWDSIPAWIAVKPDRRAGRGSYLLPEINLDVSTLKVNTNTRGRKPGSPNVKGRQGGKNASSPSVTRSVVSFQLTTA